MFRNSFEIVWNFVNNYFNKNRLHSVKCFQVKRRKKLFPGKLGNESESSDDDVFYRWLSYLCWFIYLLRNWRQKDQNASSRGACALTVLGLLLADSAPTVGRGKTFWRLAVFVFFFTKTTVTRKWKVEKLIPWMEMNRLWGLQTGHWQILGFYSKFIFGWSPSFLAPKTSSLRPCSGHGREKLCK